MSFLQSIILGAVQGITEWLPVSSEGINTLILLHFFGKPLSEAIGISIWLHVGTLVSALIYFRREIVALARYLPRYVRELGRGSASEPHTLISFLIISTLLSVVIGAPLMLFGLNRTEIPSGLVMAIIGGFLIITGLVQRFTPRFSGSRTITRKRDALLLGAVQALAIFPGLSRSGLTVSALLFRGYQAQQAIRVSFLMSIPVVLAAGIGLNLIGGVSLNVPAIIGAVVACLFGLLTISALLRMAARIRFWMFCLFLGVLSLIPLLVERL